MTEAPPPSTPQDVLKFWFNGLWGDSEKMSKPHCLTSMNPVWWGMTETFGPLKPEEQAAADASCQVFSDLARKAGKGELDGSGGPWDEEDGV